MKSQTYRPGHLTLINPNGDQNNFIYLQRAGKKKKNRRNKKKKKKAKVDNEEVSWMTFSQWCSTQFTEIFFQPAPTGLLKWNGKKRPYTPVTLHCFSIQIFVNFTNFLTAIKILSDICSCGWFIFLRSSVFLQLDIAPVSLKVLIIENLIQLQVLQ